MLQPDNSANLHYIDEDGRKTERVDCWLNKPQKSQVMSTMVKEREIVLDPKPPALSLGNLCTC